mmetsp:Transcript_12898/g.37514  ORF Transcript_12898/g.37514 Transcript_12898/m.37514 type:complete len:233 (-) Transcript_12898:68-766(-)
MPSEEGRAGSDPQRLLDQISTGSPGDHGRLVTDITVLDRRLLRERGGQSRGPRSGSRRPSELHGPGRGLHQSLELPSEPHAVLRKSRHRKSKTSLPIRQEVLSKPGSGREGISGPRCTGGKEHGPCQGAPGAQGHHGRSQELLRRGREEQVVPLPTSRLGLGLLEPQHRLLEPQVPEREAASQRRSRQGLAPVPVHGRQLPWSPRQRSVTQDLLGHSLQQHPRLRLLGLRGA